MIRVQGLTKSYRGLRAVDGVGFAIERGEVVGFLGPNGAGKSTTMRCLAGTLTPDAGTIEIAGFAVHPDALDSRRRVGYLPESTPLYGHMRGRAYLDFVGRVRGLGRAPCRAAIARVEEQCGLRGQLDRPIGELSKGLRQRVGLAQALLADPQVLILDEPTSGLDPGEVLRLRALIRELGAEKTILLSTHVLSEVQETCQRAVILAAGRVVADGTLSELAQEERAELFLVLEGAGAELAGALAALAGVRAARCTGRDAAGRVSFSLEVEERFAAAKLVVAWLAERGLAPLELRHERTSLEQVFLRRTGRAEEAAP